MPIPAILLQFSQYTWNDVFAFQHLHIHEVLADVNTVAFAFLARLLPYKPQSACLALNQLVLLNRIPIFNILSEEVFVVAGCTG